MNSLLFDVVYHATAVASHSNTHQAVTRALCSLCEVLLKLQVTLTARREALPLLGASNTTALLVDHALEGTSSNLPRPTISTLITVN